MKVPEINRVAEFKGPNQLLNAVNALKEPETDGVIVYEAVDQKFLNSLYPPILADIAKRRSVKGNDASDNPEPYFYSLLEHLPQLKEIDDVIASIWTEIAFTNTRSVTPVSPIIYARDGSATHADAEYYSAAHIWGPVGLSLGLLGVCSFGLEKLPRSLLTDKDGLLLPNKVRKFTVDYNNGYDKPTRSNVIQGIGDIALWVEPQTLHSVSNQTVDRLALVLGQSQIIQDIPKTIHN